MTRSGALYYYGAAAAVLLADRQAFARRVVKAYEAGDVQELKLLRALRGGR